MARTHALDKSGPDFWSLGVQSDGNWPVLIRSLPKALSCLADILDGLSMVLHEGALNKCYCIVNFTKFSTA